MDLLIQALEDLFANQLVAWRGRARHMPRLPVPPGGLTGRLPQLLRQLLAERTPDQRRVRSPSTPSRPRISAPPRLVATSPSSSRSVPASGRCPCSPPSCSS